MPLGEICFFTEEQIVGIWTRAADFKDLDQIDELTVYVTNNSDGRFDVHNIALFHEQLFCFRAYSLDDGLCEQLLFVQA